MVRLVCALFSDEEELVHVPGPYGLPGGYPVLVSRAGIRLAETPGLSQGQAVQINEASHRWDGIERIERDGTVVFRAESAEVLRTELGFENPVLHPDECEPRALELMQRFQEYAARHGVSVSAGPADVAVEKGVIG